MKAQKHINCIDHSLESFMPLISVKDNGAYILSLPISLRSEQHELEQMLNNLFSGSLKSPYNFDLAQQLSLNWCLAKAKKIGLICRCH